ncbi:hypothetical protein OAN21_02005 [Alphaproteobacteria bacterium]|nr:hypothetical protein [Alphaproteobacteria bacterium]
MIKWIFSGAFFFIFSLTSLGTHTAKSAAFPLEVIPFHTLFTRPIAQRLHLSKKEETTLENKALALCSKYPLYKIQAILGATQCYDVFVETIDEDRIPQPTTCSHILSIIDRLDQFEEKYPHGLWDPHTRYSSAWASIFLLQQYFKYAPFTNQLAYLDIIDQVFEKGEGNHFHALLSISWASSFFQPGPHTSEDLKNITDVVQTYVKSLKEDSSFKLPHVLRTSRQDQWSTYTTAAQLAWHLAD